MGGCKSSAVWRERGLFYEGEEPSPGEITHGYEMLRRRGDRVDVVLTHKYEPEAPAAEPLTLSALCAHIDANVDFRHWYSGHWHEKILFDDRHTAVYDTLVPLSKKREPYESACSCFFLRFANISQNPIDI